MPDVEPVRYVPRRLRLICRVVAAGVVVVFVVSAATRPDAPSGVKTGLGDSVALALLGVLLALGVLFLSRPRVEADRYGVRVRNIVGSHDLPWSSVLAVRLDRGAHWARLELPAEEYVAVLALQLQDGRYAVDGVLALRRLLSDFRRGAGETGPSC